MFDEVRSYDQLDTVSFVEQFAHCVNRVRRTLSSDLAVRDAHEVESPEGSFGHGESKLSGMDMPRGALLIGVTRDRDLNHIKSFRSCGGLEGGDVTEMRRVEGAPKEPEAPSCHAESLGRDCPLAVFTPTLE